MYYSYFERRHQDEAFEDEDNVVEVIRFKHWRASVNFDMLKISIQHFKLTYIDLLHMLPDSGCQEAET